MNNNTSKALHEIVANNIIKQLEQGTAPWQLPWNSNGPSFMLPYNAITGNRYKGINILSLLSTQREDPRWLTFKQAESKGYSVKKGEKATLIQYVKTHDYFTSRDQQGKIITREDGKPLKEFQKLKTPIITTAWVFNAQQINGIEPLIKEPKILNWENLQRVENLITESKANITHNNEDRAYYNSKTDQIIMPKRNQFDSADKYYATVLHEMGHWTSHKDRLNRDIFNRMGTQEYAREELRAEIASMLIGHELNIGHDPGQHIAYVESWIQLLKDKPYEIHAAAADAEKILNYIMAFEIKRDITTKKDVQENTKVSNKKMSSSLNMGEVIEYNNTSYKIHSLLKRGRFKVEDLSTGNNFILSKSDVLYNSLLSAKTPTKIIPININQDASHIPIKEEHSNIISIKR
ncbi:ArdC family protein [Sphingobacterium composti Ten et al. 2007 non Yoo et al. 2007]|uniref:ArdC family protein n=1 Tax=Sphingobacterium composti TaxID=363260 RepID=UPI001EEB3645|nr:zincin-like metallopeptidase domain-containing protein [Sphingobacterium composti Ten et al. 2007 non Yoo et al. 2007]